MSDIWQVTDRQLPSTVEPAYEKLLSAIGTDAFGPAVRSCIDTLTSGVRRLYLFETTGGNDGVLRYCDCEPRIAQLLPAYSRRYKRLDPIGQLYPAARRVGDLAVQRIRPSDIASAGFRRRFFDEPGIVERLSLLQRTADGWRGLNVARHRSDGSFSDSEIHQLAALARLALPMLLVPNRPRAAGRPLTGAELEARFACEWPELTMREREVCARAAIGMSVEATAIDLGIAKTSVVTFRQRAYRRLGVTSPFELCGLVAR
jgi:DNA-binding CsgD family transcriptional regulator